VGRSYAIGDDPAKHALCDDLQVVFAALKARFEADLTLRVKCFTPRRLRERRKAGWRFGGRIAGHFVGEFPYARNPHDQALRRIAPGNIMRMRDPDADGRSRHWILEVHLVSTDGAFGGFYERLLHP
jgi:Xaa-Pro dipeptidase